MLVRGLLRLNQISLAIKQCGAERLLGNGVEGSCRDGDNSLGKSILFLLVMEG